MKLRQFRLVEEALRNKGFADEDISWSEGCTAPTTPEQFALEAIYVICNSGMKHAVARQIYERCVGNLQAGIKIKGNILGKSGKAKAIDRIWKARDKFFASYNQQCTDDARIEFLGKLPWIGKITKYHLAKNFGVDCVKPDVHLVRLAEHYKTTPTALCSRLASKTGYKKRTIDVLLWRACAYGIVNSRTGQLNDSP